MFQWLVISLSLLSVLKPVKQQETDGEYRDVVPCICQLSKHETVRQYHYSAVNQYYCVSRFEIALKL